MAAGTDQSTKPFYEFGPFRVDAEKELLLRGDETVPLMPKTFQILLVLMRHKRDVVTKDELMKSVWPDTFVEEANLSRNIFLLRKALGESPQDHQYIITVPGRGYRFAEDVQIVAGVQRSCSSLWLLAFRSLFSIPCLSSQKKTRSCSPISRIQPATLSSTALFARVWLFNWNNRRF